MSSTLQQLVNQPYRHGFVTDIETEVVPKGLSEEVIRLISKKKEEPEWLLEFRLSAYRHWLTLEAPDWAAVSHPPIDFQEIIYFAQPKAKKQLASLDEVDPELLRTFEKLGVPLHDPAKPLEILRVVHSFDPCLACATHVIGEDGQEMIRVTA